jgi:hypothetical protein
LHGEHTGTFFLDPAEHFHFIERFPHSDEPGPATSRI